MASAMPLSFVVERAKVRRRDHAASTRAWGVIISTPSPLTLRISLVALCADVPGAIACQPILRRSQTASTGAAMIPETEKNSAREPGRGGALITGRLVRAVIADFAHRGRLAAGLRHATLENTAVGTTASQYES